MVRKGTQGVCRVPGGGLGSSDRHDITDAEESPMQVRKITPVMVVEAIEPLLPFWKKLGFAVTAEVPHENALGFVILAKDGLELMYQTRASVQADVPDIAAAPYAEHTPLFIEVNDLHLVHKLLGAVEYVVRERKTFYGATEAIVRGPAGQVVTFAQFGAGGDVGGEA